MLIRTFGISPSSNCITLKKNCAVRIGSQVLSYHRLPPYESWTKFKPELDAAIDALFAKADGLTIRRLGLVH